MVFMMQVVAKGGKREDPTSKQTTANANKDFLHGCLSASFWIHEVLLCSLWKSPKHGCTSCIIIIQRHHHRHHHHSTLLIKLWTGVEQLTIHLSIFIVETLSESWGKLMCCNKTVDIIESTYMSGSHMVGKYNSYHQTRDTANSSQKGIKRGNECATTASNYRKTLLNVSVMLQCIANTAWSQVTLSVRQGEGKRRKRRRRRSDREGEGKLLNSLSVPLPNRLLLILSWTKIFSWFL